MLIALEEIRIDPDSLTFRQYPFRASIAFGPCRLMADAIMNIDTTSAPPTIRVSNELLFISANQKEDLADFADRNKIPITTRDDIWDCLLEPFLDTEYTDVTHQKIIGRLAAYGLTEAQINSIRDEVEAQMYIYNFGTMLWEWVHLGAFDVLCAMQATYNPDQFADFYRRVMAIALLPDT